MGDYWGDKVPRITNYKKVFEQKCMWLGLFRCTKEIPQLFNSSAPPEGSNSGILIIQDEEVDLTCGFCCSKIDFVKDLPFPQNKNLTVSYTTSTGNNGQTINSTNQVIFIPLLNQPLSSNRYYVIERQGKHKGYV